MDKFMRTIPFDHLLHWMRSEWRTNAQIFGIPRATFFRKANSRVFALPGGSCELPLGPAAGPHTQLAQNIIAGYLTGARYFELKTVQVRDDLDIAKPCIDAAGEGYNSEWSTELSITDAATEYLKAWLSLPFVKCLIHPDSPAVQPGYVFNVSVGYDLKGIQSPKVDGFLDVLTDASNHPDWRSFQQILYDSLLEHKTPSPSMIADIVGNLAPQISTSVTLSTMHGCPPQEIEAICRHLLATKKMHTYVKLNPTLLGYAVVRDLLDRHGFQNIQLQSETFEHDLQGTEAFPMLMRLKTFAAQHDRFFGVKLSNTLPVKNTRGRLPGSEIYLSGPALYPLTISLAGQVAQTFDGELPISYCGGLDYFNLLEVARTGIYPLTLATSLLKPGGYLRLTQLSTALDTYLDQIPDNRIDLERLAQLVDSLQNFRKVNEFVTLPDPGKSTEKLPLFDCFTAPCQQGCPIGQNVPDYLYHLEKGDADRALATILADNPLPHITGYICDHQCQVKCTRNFYEKTLAVRDCKKWAAENGRVSLSSAPWRRKRPLSVKVAIIGAGPGGLACAAFLARSGILVTIYEKEPSAGGTVQHIIPNFRLPDSVIAEDIKAVTALGVKFITNWPEPIDIHNLHNQGFGYVVIAIGAGQSRPLNLDGANGKILDSLTFLRTFKSDPGSVRLGKTVAVVGGGNSAMDAARAALRADGVRTVHIIYRRTVNEMPADREELENALRDGAIFHELLTPVEFISGNRLKCQRLRLGKLDSSGRPYPIPIENSFSEIQVDCLIAAIGEEADQSFFERNGIIRKGLWYNPKTLETNITNVFIAGDARRGPATVVEAIADARTIATVILKREKIKNSATVKPAKRMDIIADLSLRKSSLQLPNIPSENRIQIQREAMRCLHCDLLCGRCVDVCPNRANFGVKVSTPGFKDILQIVHLDGLCNACGNCVTFCPYDGAPYRDKFTIFWDRHDFIQSRNSGAIYLGEGRFSVRLQKKSFTYAVGSTDSTKLSPPTITRVLEQLYQQYRFLLSV